MRILIAEDDAVSRRLLETTLGAWGYELAVVRTGSDAWAALERADRPAIAILDWMMPGMDGVDICRTVREMVTQTPPYLILLTTRNRVEDIVAGLGAGADDYLTKPFNREELRARVQVGERVVTLRQSLADRVAQLEDALSKVKQLQGLLPICAYCKKIRNDQNYWDQVETYISRHADVRFSHGICPSCFEEHIGEVLDAATPKKASGE